MDEPAAAQHHSHLRLLPHIKRLDDQFAELLVRVEVRVRMREVQVRKRWRGSAIYGISANQNGTGGQPGTAIAN